MMFYGYGKRKLHVEQRRTKERQNIPRSRFTRVSAQLQVEQTGQLISGGCFWAIFRSRA